jgi:hypothetical protein
VLSNRERRTLPRVSVRCPIKYFYLPPSSNPPETHVVDLNFQGARIEVPDPLIPGSVIAFQIITSERQVVDAHARVIYVLAEPNAFFRVGVQFLMLSENAHTLIARELESAQQRNFVSEVIHGSFSQPLQEQTSPA